MAASWSSAWEHSSPALSRPSAPEIEFLDINLESFAPCYSQSLLLADFKGNHVLFWFLESAQKNLRRRKRGRVLIRKERNSESTQKKKTTRLHCWQKGTGRNVG